MRTDRKIIKYQDLETLRKKASKQGQKTIFTSGCYDLLHLGHIIHFHYCRSRGDLLIVSVGNDKNVRSLKGPNRPMIGEEFRARHIAALECVDYVVISEEMGVMDHNELIALLQPDIYIVPGTDKYLDEKRALVERYNGKLIACRRLPPGHLKQGISSTWIESTLRNFADGDGIG